MVKKPIVKKQELYLSDDCISNCNVPFTPMFHFYTHWKRQKILFLGRFQRVWKRITGVKWVDLININPSCEIPQNVQTHSNISSAIADKLYKRA